jgi:poly-gamma-glutamate synthesis protein (capsule biosynthesis protein)
LEIEIKNNTLNSKIHPVELEKDSFKLSMLKGKKKQLVLDRFAYYSKTISDKTELSKAWKNFVNLNYNSYLNRWSYYSFIKSRYIKGVLRRIRIKGINKRGMAIYLNLMRCEAHADLSKEITQKYISKN